MHIENLPEEDIKHNGSKGYSAAELDFYKYYFEDNF
jgi:hypothetical protein